MQPFTAIVSDYEPDGVRRRTNYFTLVCARDELITMIVYEEDLDEFQDLLGDTVTVRDFAIKGPKQEHDPLMLEYTRHSGVTTHADSPPLSDVTPYLKNNHICTSILRLKDFDFYRYAGKECLEVYCTDANKREVIFTAYNYDGWQPASYHSDKLQQLKAKGCIIQISDYSILPLPSEVDLRMKGDTVIRRCTPIDML
uniref:CNH domain-containing protein n=1 Tax=Steinernema glaseri TaxID=37863 RepID=A0A1I7YDM1_9BILA